MSYQHYMNMGFGTPHGGNPYMMGYQSGLQGQMMQQSQQNQYMANHKSPVMQQQQGHQMLPPNSWHMPQGMMNSVSVSSAPPAPPPAHLQTMAMNTAPPPAAATTNTTAGVKRKLANDPNRPKRPTSAYFYFVQVEREEAAKRGEKITRVAEWTKAISAKWRELSLSQKETFQQMAASDKQRYFQQMAVYTGKDMNRPKRPQSAYFLWLADFRARVKDHFTENKEILRAAGEEWRKMTMMAKAPYEQKAEEERRKYEQAMKEYNVTGGVKKPETQQGQVNLGQPLQQQQQQQQQPPVTGYQQQHMATVTSANSLAVSQSVSDSHLAALETTGALANSISVAGSAASRAHATAGSHGADADSNDEDDDDECSDDGEGSSGSDESE